MSTGRRRTDGLWLATALGFALLCGCSCGYSVKSAIETTPPGHSTSLVRVTATPSGCRPVPASVPAGTIVISVSNLNAPTVSEIEIRTGDLAQVLGERENLVEGLSATFTLHLTQGRYVVSCPGAAQQYWPLSVSGGARKTS